MESIGNRNAGTIGGSAGKEDQSQLTQKESSHLTGKFHGFSQGITCTPSRALQCHGKATYGGPHWSTVWRALFERPILECPIGGPYWRALLRALHVEHSLENSRGPNLKGKQKCPEGKPLSSKMSPRTESSRPLLVLFSTMCSFEHVFEVNTSALLGFCPLGPELDLI